MMECEDCGNLFEFVGYTDMPDGTKKKLCPSCEKKSRERTCEKCENTYDESLFDGSSAVCNYCIAEEKAVGEILTPESIPRIMQQQFNKSKENLN